MVLDRMVLTFVRNSGSVPQILDKAIPGFLPRSGYPPRRAATAQVHGRPIVSALPFSVVNTPPHRNPLHLTHSSTQINVPNFAGYFSQFPTLMNVRERMMSATTSSQLNSSHPGRLSRPTYRQMGRSCPEKGAERPKSAPKLNVLTTLSLNSNRNSSLRDPLPPMSLSIRTFH